MSKKLIILLVVLFVHFVSLCQINNVRIYHGDVNGRLRVNYLKEELLSEENLKKEISINLNRNIQSLFSRISKDSLVFQGDDSFDLRVVILLEMSNGTKKSILLNRDGAIYFNGSRLYFNNELIIWLRSSVLTLRDWLI